MQTEVIRLLAADCFADPDLGVDAQLATLPVDAGDTPPTGVLVIDAFEDDDAAKGEQLVRGKDVVIVVSPDGPTRTTPANIHGQLSNGTTPVACTIRLRNPAMPAARARAASYVARACVLALGAYFERGGVNRGRDRTRNEVRLVGVDGVAYGLIQDDGLGAVAAVVATIHALDLRAQRTV